MLKSNDKLDTLKIISQEFNNAGITWALGGSMLLYFKGIVNEFNDIDLMVMFEDVELIKNIMHSLNAELLPPHPNDKYNSKAFLQYVINGVDVDIIAGFGIINEGELHDCSLHSDQIIEKINLDGEAIPLQSIELWHRYYKLMGRENKVRIINEKTLI